MKTDYKRFRKVPPYMTKAGIQIGLLYQEPFEARMGKDEYAFQQSCSLNKRLYKLSRESFITVD
jgi:carbohydrate-selective porin OprB